MIERPDDPEALEKTEQVDPQDTEALASLSPEDADTLFLSEVEAAEFEAKLAEAFPNQKPLLDRFKQQTSGIQSAY
ncbi:MAG: hypothetical protein H6765_06975 [Candidatus Peribacteria bacterium]|nr:MAG: hypothetical protein H6765_06975 [Candidatus Peribacteria bacterium]